MAKGVDERVLLQIAEDIRGDHKKLPIFAHELGFQSSVAQGYMSTNTLGGTVTTKGTLDMLRDWKESHLRADQGPKLKAALMNAGFSEIAGDHLKQHRVPKGSLREPGASRSAGTSIGSAAASTRAAKAQKEVKVKPEKASPRPTEANKRKSTDDGAGTSGKSGKASSSGAKEQKKPKAGTTTKAKETSSAKPRQGKAKPSTAKKGGK